MTILVRDVHYAVEKDSRDCVGARVHLHDQDVQRDP